jgi:hypothetical protein
MKKVGIGILANAGYGKDQVQGVTLGELRGFIDEMIESYGEDTEIITVDRGNKYGANYGKLYLTDELENDYDEEEEEE